MPNDYLSQISHLQKTRSILELVRECSKKMYEDIQAVSENNKKVVSDSHQLNKLISTIKE